MFLRFCHFRKLAGKHDAERSPLGRGQALRLREDKLADCRNDRKKYVG